MRALGNISQSFWSLDLDINLHFEYKGRCFINFKKGKNYFPMKCHQIGFTILIKSLKMSVGIMNNCTQLRDHSLFLGPNSENWEFVNSVRQSLTPCIHIIFLHNCAWRGASLEALTFPILQCYYQGGGHWSYANTGCSITLHDTKFPISSQSTSWQLSVKSKCYEHNVWSFFPCMIPCDV